MKGVPDFIIIGAQRCGTTSLQTYLAAHPDIVAPRMKEVDFFTNNYDRGFGWYDKQLGPKRPGKLRGEKSPNYLIDRKAPVRIAKLGHPIKFIVILRNPVDRIYSHWKLMRKLHLDARPFDEAIHYSIKRRDGWYPYLKRGHYAEQLEHWFSTLTIEQFYIIRSKDFYKNTGKVYNKVLRFLGLSPHQLKVYKKYGRTSSWGKISENMREWLTDYYRPHNRRLNELLGRQFWND